MEQPPETVCPVCTLTVRRDILLEDHLNTHPKDQVIKALIGKCSATPTYPIPPPITPTFQFIQPPNIQYPYNFIPIVYNPFGVPVPAQASFLPQAIFNAPSIQVPKAAITSNGSVNINGLTITNVSNTSVNTTPSPLPVPVSVANVATSIDKEETSSKEDKEDLSTSPVLGISNSASNDSVAITEVMEIHNEDQGVLEHESILPDKDNDEDDEDDDDDEDCDNVFCGDREIDVEHDDDEPASDECCADADGQVNQLIVRLEDDGDYITPEYSSRAYSPLAGDPKKLIDDDEEEEPTLSEHLSMEQYSPRDTVSMRDIQTDETMPAQGELSEQESIGGDTASLWGPAAEDVFSEVASHGGHGPSTHLLSDWPPINATQQVEITSSRDAATSTSSSCVAEEQFCDANMKVEIKTEQWVKVECDEVKQEHLELEPGRVSTIVPSLLQQRIADTTEKALIGVIGEESLLVQQSDVRRQQQCTTCDASFITLRDLQNHRRKEHRTTKFTCTICNLDFTDRVELFTHSRSHPLECLQCGKTFNKRAGLTLHMKRHLGVKPHKCTICDKGFVTKQKLSEHFNTHTGRTPFKCKVCNKGFKRHSNLIQHRRWVHLKIRKPIQDLNCDHCDKIFHTKKRLSWHLEIHLKTPRICSFCPQRFVHRSSLTRHIRTMHDRKYIPAADRQSVECPECLGIFCRTSLAHHLRTHSGERPHTCNICFKAFSTKWNLQQHRYTHESPTNLPLKCTLCRKSYYRREDLEVHIRGHKNNRPFTCDFCGRKFSRRYNCMRHMREHVAAKLYTCNICNKTFHRNYYLKEHMRVHTGHRPFQCHICGKGSTTKSNHNKHVKTHHARESVTPEG